MNIHDKNIDPTKLTTKDLEVLLNSPHPIADISLEILDSKYMGTSGDKGEHLYHVIAYLSQEEIDREGYEHVGPCYQVIPLLIWWQYDGLWMYAGLWSAIAEYETLEEAKCFKASQSYIYNHLQ